jgi:hypothetical protein
MSYPFRKFNEQKNKPAVMFMMENVDHRRFITNTMAYPKLT